VTFTQTDSTQLYWFRYYRWMGDGWVSLGETAIDPTSFPELGLSFEVSAELGKELAITVSRGQVPSSSWSWFALYDEVPSQLPAAGYVTWQWVEQITAAAGRRYETSVVADGSHRFFVALLRWSRSRSAYVVRAMRDVVGPVDRRLTAMRQRDGVEVTWQHARNVGRRCFVGVWKGEAPSIGGEGSITWAWATSHDDGSWKARFTPQPGTQYQAGYYAYSESAGRYVLLAAATAS
jgi:hypothetical protein